MKIQTVVDLDIPNISPSFKWYFRYRHNCIIIAPIGAFSNRLQRSTCSVLFMKIIYLWIP